MRESKTKEIDGLIFTVQQMPVKRSIKLMHRLARAGLPALLKAVGPAKLEGMGDGGLKGLLESLDLSSFGDAATMLFDKFHEADLDHAMAELFEGSTVESGGNLLPVLKAFDVSITQPGTVLKALGFALEVNYGDFSGAFLAAAGTLEAKAAPKSTA